MHEITPSGEYRCSILGDRTSGDPDATYQVWIKHDHWYAKEMVDKSSYILYTDVVIPGRKIPTGHTTLLRRWINVINVDSSSQQRRVPGGYFARAFANSSYYSIFISHCNLDKVVV